MIIKLTRVYTCIVIRFKTIQNKGMPSANFPEFLLFEKASCELQNMSRR